MTSAALCFKIGLIVGTLATANQQLKILGMPHHVPRDNKQVVRDFVRKCHADPTDERVVFVLQEPEK